MLSKQTLNWISGILLGLSFAGFLDSVFLTAKHYLGFSVVCTIFSGCETVLGSTYAQILGIPVALFGVIFYLGVGILSLVYFDTKKILFLKLAAFFPFAGFLFSLWLIFVQAVLLKAFCFWCLVSASISFLLFVTSLFFWMKQADKKSNLSL